ncbi:hypothetical protein NDU88_003314 [Pleurodeles waltl]|uniref:Uncharacterized protein n=1 Tax=Pleurodeles waltl TaxID=8319 RepID=A0AAV7M4U3_PLEWA|nr:hypothetical protein NDU88_003314 [Pleurodeles waltl]
MSPHSPVLRFCRRWVASVPGPPFPVEVAQPKSRASRSLGAGRWGNHSVAAAILFWAAAGENALISGRSRCVIGTGVKTGDDYPRLAERRERRPPIEVVTSGAEGAGLPLSVGDAVGSPPKAQQIAGIQGAGPGGEQRPNPLQVTGLGPEDKTR